MKNKKNAIETRNTKKSKMLAGTTRGPRPCSWYASSNTKLGEDIAPMPTVLVAPCLKEIYVVLFYLCASAIWKLHFCVQLRILRVY